MGTMIYLEVLMAMSRNPHGLVSQHTAGNDPQEGQVGRGTSGNPGLTMRSSERQAFRWGEYILFLIGILQGITSLDIIADKYTTRQSPTKKDLVTQIVA